MPKELPSEWVKSSAPDIDPSTITRLRAVYRGSNGELTTIRLAKTEVGGVDISITPGNIPLEAPEIKRDITVLDSLLEGRPKVDPVGL